MIKKWVSLPTRWIEGGGLKQFAWKEQGSDATASLICLMLIAHHTDNSGLARLTYDQFGMFAGLSRAKISNGLKILEDAALIIRRDRSVYQLVNYNPSVSGWGMLPAKGLYSGGGSVPFFKGLFLRSRVELDALKIYLLFVARRDSNRNCIDLSYDKISEYSGIGRAKIPSALTLLSVNDLIRSERMKSNINDFATSNSYRLSYLDSYKHGGTFGRQSVEVALRDDDRY